MRAPSYGVLFWVMSSAMVNAAMAQEHEAHELEKQLEKRGQEVNRLRTVQSREVGEHRFIAFQVVSWPVVTTRINSVTGLGSFRTSQSGEDLTLLKLLEGFVFDWAVLPQLSLSGQIIGAAAQGIHLEGIFKAGESYAFGGSTSALWRLVASDRFYLSARLLGGILNFDSIVPERVINTIQIVGGDVTLQRPQINEGGLLYRVKPALATAIGVRRWLGFQVSGGLDIDTVVLDAGGTDVNTTLDLGGGASFDLRGTGIATTLLLGARLLHDFNEEEPFNPAIQTRGRTRGEFELGGYYSGRRELDLGFSLVSAVGSGDYSLIGNGVINYYYW